MAVGIWGGPLVWPRVDEITWMTPEQLVREGFRRSRVVMMNEARSDLRRCERTRRIGARILPMARACGATLLAMEALGTPEGPPPTGGALAQPDMVALLEQARLQGFTLTGYDVDDAKTPVKLKTKIKSPAYTNWRNSQQAANLARLFSALPEDERMLVWCTNLHHATARFMAYRPMGWLFMQNTKLTPFSIDQTVTVDWTGQRARSPVLKWAARELTDRGGNAGFVWKEGLPRLSPGCDAFVLSLDNELT